MSTGGLLDPGRRRARTVAALARMRTSIDRWIAGWKSHPAQHSQIARLTETLSGLMQRLGERGERIATDDAAHQQCRDLEFDAAFVERMWTYYRERLDPRLATSAAAASVSAEELRVGRLLAAADDVIWACWELASALRPDGADRELPLPLAFLEPAYTATAPPRDRPPPGLRPADLALAEVVRQMPVPLIGLPTTILDEPWWLAVLAHEAGHHALYDLEPDQGLVTRVGELLAAAGGPAWGRWQHEVFADAFAVAALGPEAVEVTAALEWGSADQMAKERGAYPPVIVRLALAAEVAAVLGFPSSNYRAAAWQPRLAELSDPAARDRITAALAIVAGAPGKPDQPGQPGLPKQAAQPEQAAQPGLAAQLAALPIGRASLLTTTTRTWPAEVDPTAPRDRSEAPSYARMLAGQQVILQPQRRKARLAIAAAFRAFRTAAVVDEQLGERTLALVKEVRDTTTSHAIPRSVTPSSDDPIALVLAQAAAARAQEQGA